MSADDREVTTVHEFDESDRLRNGSIVAVVADKNVFWLARLHACCGSAQARWQGEWLEQSSSSSFLYTIARGYEPAIIWKDTILCDITHAVIPEADCTWSLPHNVVQDLRAMLLSQSALHSTSSVFPTARHTSRNDSNTDESLTVSEHVIRSISLKCSRALELVSFFFCFVMSDNPHHDPHHDPDNFLCLDYLSPHLICS